MGDGVLPLELDVAVTGDGAGIASGTVDGDGGVVGSLVPEDILVELGVADHGDALVGDGVPVAVTRAGTEVHAGEALGAVSVVVHDIAHAAGPLEVVDVIHVLGAVALLAGAVGLGPGHVEVAPTGLRTSLTPMAANGDVLVGGGLGPDGAADQALCGAGVTCTLDAGTLPNASSKTTTCHGAGVELLLVAVEGDNAALVGGGVGVEADGLLSTLCGKDGLYEENYSRRVRFAFHRREEVIRKSR